VVGLKDMIPEREPGGARSPLFHNEDDTSFDHLRWMADHLLTNIDTFPTDKTSRWIGFIQGVMVMKGALSTKHERDRTRPLFHEAYKAMGMKIPPTVN
jgi:hypothetical protein